MPSPNQWPSKASSSPSSCVLVRTAATGWSPAFTASRRQLKWQEINCTVFDHMEADEAELAEIDENLIRTNLTPAEEAMHLTRRKELYEKVHGKAKTKGARAANKKMGKKNGATDNLSDAF